MILSQQREGNTVFPKDFFAKFEFKGQNTVVKLAKDISIKFIK